ncbi:hypothetical protein G3N18_10190 [Microbacterium sp. 2C]|uniref:hypothetical protein n=1 Tax=Microbacterium paulum TaxID=2707006 RepID=UPI0018C32EE4|nr:hypothetical protein [Microbacterium paulum]MBG0718428.1 hypothetical protein [Microbacterium paulum]
MNIVSGDSAPDGVVVTAAIPTSIKVSDITSAGKGDDSVFPTRKSCAITGQNAGGVGGNFTCELFGPLQVAGKPVDAASVITLSARVSTAAVAGPTTNTAAVNDYTFGDPVRHLPRPR